MGCKIDYVEIKIDAKKNILENNAQCLNKRKRRRDGGYSNSVESLVCKSIDPMKGADE